MAKFGLFESTSVRPIQEYEGEAMEQNGDHVYIYVFEEPGRKGRREQVAAIKLGNGQSVKKISS